MRAKIGIFRSLIMLTAYRHRLAEGVLLDARQRYVGSVFGFAWTVLFPLLQLSIYAVVYVFILKIRPATMTPPQYLTLVFSGLVPLMAFNEILMVSTGSLLAQKSLLMNTLFPAELIPVRAALSTHASALIALSITLVAGYTIGNASYQAVIMVPILWVLLMMFGIGIAWILSLLNLIARDVQHLLGLIMMTLFILSPFAYTPEMVPDSLRAILYFNPLSYFVFAFQQVICYGAWPTWPIMVACVGLSCTTFLVGFSFFRRTKFIFFDYV